MFTESTPIRRLTCGPEFCLILLCRIGERGVDSGRSELSARSVRGGHKVRRTACDIKKRQFDQRYTAELLSVQFFKPNSAGKHGEEKVGVLGSPKWLEKGRSDQKVGLVRGEKRCLLF